MATPNIPVVDCSSREEIIRMVRENQPFLLAGWSFRPKRSAGREKESPQEVIEQLLGRFGSNLQVPVFYCCAESTYGVNATIGPPTKPLGEALSYLTEDHRGSAAITYLKDWHICRSPGDPAAGSSAPSFYDLPWGFDDDWLNGWADDPKGVRCNQIPDDYRFLYAGPRGSWTPMHHDVLSSFSWSVNLCGKKRWILFPPEDTPALTDNDGTLVSDVRPLLLAGSSGGSGASRALAGAVSSRALVVDQEAGLALFVPSGWHHQVENLETTISVNHNWFNGFNLNRIVDFMLLENTNMRNMLLDLRDDFIGEDNHDDDDSDQASGNSVEQPQKCACLCAPSRPWERHIEKLLRANGGMPLSELFALLESKVACYYELFSEIKLQDDNSTGAGAEAAEIVGTSTASAERQSECEDSPALPGQLNNHPCIAWGASEDYYLWVDRTQAGLWGEGGSSAVRDGSDEDLGGQAAAAAAASSPGCSQEKALDMRVAAHALLEITRALAKLSERPHINHLFLPWGRRRDRSPPTALEPSLVCCPSCSQDSDGSKKNFSALHQASARALHLARGLMQHLQRA